jgi:hypothetical protein
MIANPNQATMPLNAFKMAVKNIGGKLYRLNPMVNIPKPDSMNNYQDDSKPNVREFKFVTKKISDVLSDDDATSEEEYSNNVSFIDDDEDSTSKADRLEDFEDGDVDSYMLFADKEKGSQVSTNKSTPMLKKSPPPKFKWTHFLSIPFHGNKEFLEKFEYFKKKIIEENFSDINETLFQKKSRLHMTICLFKIEENKQKETLALINKLMKECEDSIKKILDGSPLYIDFDQLETMGTMTKTRVLHTRPHVSNSEKLRDIIDILINKFIENDLITEDQRESSHIFFNEIAERYENEKLHVTLMNSTFVLRENFNKNNSTTQLPDNAYFNGMKIIKRMKNFSFGIHQVDEFFLNEMRIDRASDSYRVQDKFKILY